jgi:hypothetical protein
MAAASDDSLLKKNRYQLMPIILRNKIKHEGVLHIHFNQLIEGWHVSLKLREKRLIGIEPSRMMIT